MAYIQKITPPPNKVLNFSLRNFAGGLNNASDQPEDNDSTDLMNVMFCDETLMETRKGQEYFDTINLNSKPVTFIDEFKPYNDVDKLLRASDTELFIGGIKVTNISSRINGINHNGRYMFSDGNKLWVYGKFAQTTTTYEKVIGTAINNFVLLEVVSPADAHPRLDTTHTKGVLNIDYTNYKIFYEPCENEFKDNYKGANKVPLKAKYIASHSGRIYVSGSDKDNDNVYISDIKSPFYFPVSLPMQLPPNSDKITGMKVYDDAVVVGRENDIYTITGNTNRPDMGVEPFKLKKLNSHCGFISNNAVTVAHNYLLFLGSDGEFYALSSVRYDEKILSTQPISKKLNLTKYPISLTPSDYKDAYGYFYNNHWYVTIKDKVLIYSYQNRAWTLWKDLNARSFYNLDDTLIWGNESGRTVKHSINHYDFGKPYKSYWTSKSFDMDDANSFKQFREFFLVAHTYKEYYSDINAIFLVDYEEVEEISSVIDQISVWGKMRWGARFIRTNIVASLPFVLGRRGRNIRIKLENGWYIKEEIATLSDLENVQKKNNTLIKINDIDKYYLFLNNEWKEILYAELNQIMKVYQINGDYEMRGKR